MIFALQFVAKIVQRSSRVPFADIIIVQYQNQEIDIGAMREYSLCHFVTYIDLYSHHRS